MGFLEGGLARIARIGAVVVAVMTAGGCGEPPPPHTCQGIAVTISATGSTEPQQAQEELAALRQILEAELDGVTCFGFADPLSCAQGDVCGLQTLDGPEILRRIREVVERERPELVTASNPQLDPCPCRVY